MESASGPAGAYRRVLLVGFMGSGKSTVGTLLAARIGWPFVDFDDEIERRAGATVREIFAAEGEAAFRALESRVGADLLELDGVILATGGGWPAAAEGRIDRLPGDVLSVWLRVEPRTAVGRVQGQDAGRPLLNVADPVAEAERLLAERTRHYERARLHLDTDGAEPDDLVSQIVERMSAD